MLLSSSVHPVFPRMPYQQTRISNQKEAINNIVSKYHSSNLINLEDQITFYEQEEYLKRQYGINQYHNKITALSEYYKFHFQAPRLFMSNIYNTIQDYVTDKRDLEFDKVTKMVQSKKQPTKAVASKKNHTKRLLQNIEVSYVDFENKNNNGNKTKNENKKPVFRQIKPQTTPIGLSSQYKGLTRQKSTVGSGFETQRLTKQPSLNTLVRAKSKKNIGSEIVCPVKIPYTQRELATLYETENRSVHKDKPAHKTYHNRNNSKPTLTKTKSSMNIKTISLKNVESNKNSLKSSKNQSNVTENKQNTKPLTSRKMSTQDSINKHQTQNPQFSNKYRVSIGEIIFKKSKLR